MTCPLSSSFIEDEADKKSCTCSRWKPIRMVLLIVVMLVLVVIAGLRWRSFLSHENAMNRIAEEFAVLVGSRPESSAAFDLTTAIISSAEILSGGPDKDGIPSLTDPNRIAVREVNDMQPNDRIVAVDFNGEAVGYPLRILNWHEAINDTVGGVHVVVTYCPLCDSAAVFDRSQDGDVLEFGISGLLHNSNVLLYDRQASASEESLWSQVQFRAVSGPRAGQFLKTLPFEMTTWELWSTAHPEGEMVSFDTGHHRDYSRNPYAGYFTSDRLMFGVSNIDNRLGTKERVIGILSGSEAVAVPIAALEAGENHISFAGETARLIQEADGHVAIASVPEGVQAIHTFWFAWVAMHPNTSIYGLD